MYTDTVVRGGSGTTGENEQADRGNQLAHRLLLEKSVSASDEYSSVHS